MKMKYGNQLLRRNILSGNSRHWILAQVKDRADNSFEGFTHFAMEP